MGRDKALVAFEGTPMSARVAHALRDGGCDPVVAIGGDSAALQALGLATIADRWPGEGPLGGVITALEQFSEHEAVVVVACDLPKLSSATVAMLVDELLRAPATADVALAVTDRQQYLCAAWRPSASSQLTAMFASGGRRLLDALASLRVVEVVVDATQLINVNTAADLPG